MLNVPNPQRNSNLWLIEKKSYDKPRQHIKKQRHYCANKGPSNQGYGFSSSHVRMWELDYKESWALKNWCFWAVVLEKPLESPLDCKEIQQVHPKGDQSWMFIASVRKHLTEGFLCAVLDLSGIFCLLLIPEYSGIKRSWQAAPGAEECMHFLH